MKRNNILKISASIMVILGIVIITLGFTSAPRVLIPPVITGIGFLIIAWVFAILKEK
jgi:hypothetical protein